MRIVIDISDLSAQASVADARPVVTVDNAAGVTESSDRSGGSAPAVGGGVVALSSLEDRPSDLSGGAAAIADGADHFDGGAASF